MYLYTHLLVAPVPFLKVGNELYIEAQTRQGIRRWLDNFETLVFAAPVIPDGLAKKRKEVQWLPIDDLKGRFCMEPLPWAYRPDQFLKQLPATISTLNRLIRNSRYLQFNISGFWGDWAGVAAEIAIYHNLKFAVHTDRVEHEVLLRLLSQYSFFKRLYLKLNSSLMQLWHRRIISRCHLGLFHGMDTYSIYSKWMKITRDYGGNICCIHDILDGDGFSDELKFSLQVNNCEENKVLNIFYAGRIIEAKAPFDWLGVLELLNKRGLNYFARWIGDGNLYQNFILSIKEKNLQGSVEAPGFLFDRNRVGKMYRDADIFLFTHITPESPRCLLEALRFGVPIVGYESEFAKDLICRHGGGLLVPVGDIVKLSCAVEKVISDKNLLKDLKERAFDDGKKFASDAVFLERSKLIKKYL